MAAPVSSGSIGHNIVWDRLDISNLIGAISLAFWLCNGIPLVYEIYSTSNFTRAFPRLSTNNIFQKEKVQMESVSALYVSGRSEMY